MGGERETDKFAERAGRIFWLTVLLVSAAVILLFASFAGSPFGTDFSIRNPDDPTEWPAGTK